MIRPSRALLALAVTCALSACQQSSAPPNAPAASSSAAPAASTAPSRTAEAAPAAAAPAAPAASASSIGIVECDDYLNKYQACVESKVPEASRAALVSSLDQTRAAWRSALGSPGGKEGLTTACKQMHDASKASLSAYGCTDF